jgi:hypothetical protein
MATSRSNKSYGDAPQPLAAKIAGQKVTDLGFSDSQLKAVSPRVRSLTVGDLQDFARAMEGITPTNKAVASLTPSDIKGIEDLFSAYRSSALQALGAGGTKTLATARLRISISCCCCTPCCSCCGAADVDPFESSVFEV